MGTANDFMNSFLKAHPEAASGKLSMEELNFLLKNYQNKLNSAPVKDFDGLSPEQMTSLIYKPFAEGGVLSFKENLEEHLDQVSLFKLSELLISKIEEAGQLKLTKINENLPERICRFLYDQNLIHWKYMDYVPYMREEYIPFAGLLKHSLLDLGIIKKRNHALSLTQKGIKQLKEEKSFRFKQLFLFFGVHFDWGNFYNLNIDENYGHLGWAYSLYLISKYGEVSRDGKFYSQKLLEAFHKELLEIKPTESERGFYPDYHYIYSLRFIECFANWFGLVKIERKKDPDHVFRENLIITKTPIFDQLFEVSLSK